MSIRLVFSTNELHFIFCVCIIKMDIMNQMLLLIYFNLSSIALVGNCAKAVYGKMYFPLLPGSLQQSYNV